MISSIDPCRRMIQRGNISSNNTSLPGKIIRVDRVRIFSDNRCIQEYLEMSYSDDTREYLKRMASYGSDVKKYFDRIDFGNTSFEFKGAGGIRNRFQNKFSPNSSAIAGIRRTIHEPRSDGTGRSMI